MGREGCERGAKAWRVRPGLRPALPLHWPQPLPGDGQLGRVHDFGLAAAVGELQRAVPLALRLAHDGAGGVVLDFGRHSAGVGCSVVVKTTQTQTKTWSPSDSESEARSMASWFYTLKEFSA